ncbi:hypothetical protein VY88_33220 [Azospirillum thiophilum]|uniref:Uncharacterized protein n=1 Tax=Azospirillum thiophilum TaxID=528244 RepID=A0AAC9EYT1_9PROT|nr:hypothetical protein [Azospirillum thiophilum]ALG75746.1 hypothetical protein AL072_32970 [Azospirillum thiophilum]KJR61195.1 hypothetical protein VY88_33220 [Azospirillum thiophilum]
MNDMVTTDRLAAMGIDEAQALVDRLVAGRPVLAQALAVMPIQSPHMRCQWLVTPDTVIDGDLSPLEAADRHDLALDEVIVDLARGHGAD